MYAWVTHTQMTMTLGTNNNAIIKPTMEEAFLILYTELLIYF